MTVGGALGRRPVAGRQGAPGVRPGTPRWSHGAGVGRGGACHAWPPPMAWNAIMVLTLARDGCMALHNI